MATRLSFLDVAEIILREHHGPLAPDDIVRLALERGELNTRGATPETAMRARLAVDIRTHGSESRFQRIGPNRFVLRDWGFQESSSGPKERVACVAQEGIDKIHRFFGYTDDFHPYAELVSNRENLIFFDRGVAEARNDVKQLISYIFLEDRDGRILTYRRGGYSTSARFLKGSYCIGFGGHVEIDDAQSLFGYRNGGTVACAWRELSEELGGLSLKQLELVGSINDDSSPNGLRHFAFVFRGKLTDDFKLYERQPELGVNSLALLTPSELWQHFHEFEFWSQLLIRRFYPRPPNFGGIVISSDGYDRTRGPIVLVGEIASGKTEVASQLKSAHGVASVSTRECVAELINIDDFGTGDRLTFQERAAALVSSDHGLDALANLIVKRVEKYNKRPVIVDGVRNIGTVARLRRRFPRMLLLYIEAPRDRAYEFFCSRGSKNPSVETMNEFRISRSHPVEREVPLLKYRATRANAVVFNDGSLLELRRKLNDWWTRGAMLEPQKDGPDERQPSRRAS